MKLHKRIAALLFGALLGVGLALPAFGQDAVSHRDFGSSKFSVQSGRLGSLPHIDADDSPAPALHLQPRGGSFGGGGRSFGGGGFSGSSQPRGSGGGSFGGGGSGTGRSGFGGTSSPRAPGTSGGSFGNGGRAFGGSGNARGTNITGGAPRGYTSTYYGGRTVYYAPAYGWGGYSYGWFHPAWYYYTPFYPAFYYDRPYIGPDGFYHAGGFSFIHALGGFCCCPLIFIGIIWMFSRGFGRRSVKYTTYK
ncbi:MAG TPA: hypothetical protein VKT78_04395 [Fimbriimonadaceae bacterium]|nr:hypothetical protein [Fimbriimonadaceae bacterium]